MMPSRMQIWPRAACVALCLALVAPRARAEERTATVAVLPLAAADARMEMYGKPVADALVRHVRASVPAGVSVVSMDAGSATPASADLVIAGRIVAPAAGAIVLEAQVRDPERGEVLATVTTGAGPLTAIDELARVLASRLDAPLGKAVAAARRGPFVAPETVIEVAPQPGEPAARVRPRVAIFGTVGEAAGGAVRVDDLGTDAAAKLAAGLGLEPVETGVQGMPPLAQAAQVIARTGAGLGLFLHVRSIDFSWKGVLLARGAVRVVVVDGQGRAVYDRTHRTDTLVGSRGDRHRALVRFVLAQAHDMARPELARLVDAMPGGAP